MPITGSVRTSLTLKSILDKISEYDIYRFYLGHDFKLGKSIHSPFHKDENPSFAVTITKENFLHHMDFSESEKKGNCIQFVMQLHSIEFREALIKIDRDFGLGLYSGEVKDYKAIVKDYNRDGMEDHKKTIIQVVTKPFDTADLAYWNSYHLDRKDLSENDVYSVKKIYLNRKLFPLSVTELVFAYLFEDKWKIYRPFGEKKGHNKWITNVPGDRMSGMHRIVKGCKTAVVTKAKKDEMVLAKFLPNVCSVQSESVVSINKTNILLLQQNCMKTYLNFDSDEVGVQNCKYYNQFGFGWVNCPKGYITSEGKMIKDFADLAKYQGMEMVQNYFKSKGII